jgi:molybdopterin molybdotransferase
MHVDKDRGFRKLSKFDDALRVLLDRVVPVSGEEIDTINGIGRIPINDIVADSDSPPFDRAAMDGYALISRYATGASPTNPIRFKVVGEAKTAKPFKGAVGPYEAVRIDTGAPLPEGADAVVMVEDTIRDGEYVDILSPVSPYQNVSIKGEDIKKGDVIVYGGIPLTPVDVATLLSIGVEKIDVYRKVRISIASIGNELVDIDRPLKEGYIRETNRIVVGGLLDWLPVEIVRSEILRDDYDDIRKFVYESVRDSDVIVTTGGTSLGMGDYVTDIADELGEVLVHGVALQPSKPVLISIVDGKPYLGLPGYPVAATISTELIVVPTVMKMAGIRGMVVPTIIRARLGRRVASRLGFRQIVRVKLRYIGGEYIAEPLWASGAGVMSSLSKADGYLIIPENLEGYEEGSLVDILVFRRVIKV